MDFFQSYRCLDQGKVYENDNLSKESVRKKEYNSHKN